MGYELQKLGYGYDSLEPFIDKETMIIHHTKHHQAYVDKLNSAINKHPELFNRLPEELIKDLSAIPEDIKTDVINNGGGVVNHDFFWTILKKGTEEKGPVVDAIIDKWGSFDKFKEEFSSAALKRFGSGWAWLVIKGKDLEIISTPNQESPLSKGSMPLIAIDVWEHAYYLKYHNRRAEYIKAFFNIINWERINNLFIDNKGK